MTKQEFEDLGNGVHELQILSTGQKLIIEITKNVVCDIFTIQMKRLVPVENHLFFTQSEDGIEIHHTYAGFIFKINYEYDNLFLIVK